MKKEEKVSYSDKIEDIERIIEIVRNYSFNELKKTLHYEESILSKDTNEELLRETYPLFHKLKLIGLRKKLNSNENYDLYYELDDGTAVVFAIDIRTKPPTLINAFRFSRNLRRFIEYIS